MEVMAECVCEQAKLSAKVSMDGAQKSTHAYKGTFSRDQSAGKVHLHLVIKQ